VQVSAGASPCHILLIEDSAEVTRLVQQTITSSDATFTVEVAGRLDAALRVLGQRRPDAVVLDLGLPDSDGLDTLSRISVHAPGVPVIVLTANDDESLALRALDLGAQDYVVKSEFEMRTLVRTINRAIQRSNGLRALREKHEQFRLMVNELPVVLWSTDRDLRLTTSMGAALRKFGLKEDQLVGTLLADYIGDPDSSVVQNGRQALRGSSLQYEFAWQGRNLEIYQEPLRDEKGVIIGTVGMSLDVTERKSGEKQLRESIASLRRVSHRLNVIREQERSRIARDIHDHLGQALTALKMDVAEIRRRVAAGDAVTIDERLKEMSALLDTTVADVRRVATELRPVVLDDLGLVAAIEAYLLDLDRRAGVHCVLVTDMADLRIPPERATALFRILQEALTNVIRHAGAQNIEVSLTAAGGDVCLSVHDDGCGISETAIQNARTLGLLGMRDQATMYDGSVAVTGRPGKGTSVIAQIPLA
jgi:two-component system sensor histidine kinase UhpB